MPLPDAQDFGERPRDMLTELMQELKAQWLKETTRATHKASGDGFKYAANVRLNSRLYKPLYRFSEQHGFNLSTSLQYAVYHLLSTHAI